MAKQKTTLQKPKEAKKNRITKDMSFAEALGKNHKAGEIIFKYGLHCIGCHVAAFETIEQGARSHGMSEAEIKRMLEEINKAK